MIRSHPDGAGEPIVFSAPGFQLQGWLHLPAAPHRPPFVIGSHGLFSTGDSPKQLALARECNAAGMAYFRFDHRGCGRSSGRFHTATSLAARCTDLFSAVETLQRRSDLSSRFGLFGSSFGGAVCIAGFARTAASSIVVNAAPVRGRTLQGAEAAANGPPELHASFYRTLLQFDVSENLAELRTVSIFHGDADRVVPLENAFEIYRRAGDPKKITIFENGDHRMSCAADQQRFVQESVDWFRKHLDP
jgi:alpha-beta hydrolase superfamily lysophospholipase